MDFAIFEDLDFLKRRYIDSLKMHRLLHEHGLDVNAKLVVLKMHDTLD